MIRTGADEARSPKYAHVERERRWLIDPASIDDRAADAVLIEDRYLIGTRLRLRRMTAADGTVALKLTRKYESDDPLARPIVTAYLTDTEFSVLATLPGAFLVKRRAALIADGVTYCLDRFDGALAGLVLAEIEWPDAAGLRLLPPPPGTVRDVSDDARYDGGTLAALGRPKE